MAELPDLTVFSRILTRKFKGQKLAKLDVTIAKKLNVTIAELTAALEGQELEEVKREGKTLQFHFSGGRVLGLHLMLRGELVELENDEVPRFQILAFHFKNGTGFAVVDMQKQATPTLNPKPVESPDALTLDKTYFTGLLAKKRTLIKTLLMDQHLIRGIGNSYADEILYHARVSPFSTANAIPAIAVTRIFKSINEMLHTAIDEIAEANGDELAGELKDFMRVHSPKLKLTAKGEVIKSDKIGGRTTYYTDAQELFT
jgi:formamidopyrimidine-DNA glycosylase